jgi:hypothetical protein
LCISIYLLFATLSPYWLQVLIFGVMASSSLHPRRLPAVMGKYLKANVNGSEWASLIMWGRNLEFIIRQYGHSIRSESPLPPFYIRLYQVGSYPTSAKRSLDGPHKQMSSDLSHLELESWFLSVHSTHKNLELCSFHLYDLRYLFFKQVGSKSVSLPVANIGGVVFKDDHLY